MHRSLALLAVIALLSVPARAATISDRDAATHVGEMATVVGIVTGTHVTAKGTEFLDFGGRYPNSDFTVVIFADEASQFRDIAGWYGKKVAVTGRIKLYHGRPEIVVETQGQLHVVH